MVDPVLRESSHAPPECLRCIHIGLLCVQENASDRPTMASIVMMLNSFSLDLPVPSKPPAFIQNAYDLEASLEESNLVKEIPRNCQKEGEKNLFIRFQHPKVKCPSLTSIPDDLQAHSCV